MQTKFSFDKETCVKILKGAIIAATGAAALSILEAIGALHISNQYLAPLVAFLVPFLTNVVKEWVAGK